MANKDLAPFSEKRRAKRAPVPIGTTALFLSGVGSLEKIYVLDISVIGMLLCDYRSVQKYSLNSSIYNIYIDIPPSESNAASETRLLIDNGKIVRSFFDKASETFCYGIELTYESSYVKETIEGLVNNA
jgi:hypothetical protein